MARSTLSRLISKVAVMANDCWLWTDALDKHGYLPCDAERQRRYKARKKDES